MVESVLDNEGITYTILACIKSAWTLGSRMKTRGEDVHFKRQFDMSSSGEVLNLQYNYHIKLLGQALS